MKNVLTQSWSLFSINRDSQYLFCKLLMCGFTWNQKFARQEALKINLNKGVCKNKAESGFPDRCCSKSENEFDRDVFHAKVFNSDAIKGASNLFYHLCNSQYAGVEWGQF